MQYIILCIACTLIMTTINGIGAVHNFSGNYTIDPHMHALNN